MTEVLAVYDQFSPILIENYIRFQTAVKNTANEENGAEKTLAAAKFKIAKEFYEKLINCEYQGPLSGLEIKYDEESEVLTAVPTAFFWETYSNKIMRDVAVKQAEEYKLRYSKFITLVD